MKVFAVILFAFFTGCCFGQNQPLFKITTNNKVGYINQVGQVVIPPVYLSGGDFSDGVAAVRQNGLYGYINSKGKFVIKPQFDFATQFYHGFAFAFKNGDTLIINKKGLRALPAWCRKANYIGEDKVEVKTRTGTAGCFDMRTKKLCIDTLFNSIGGFKHGVALACKYLPAKNNKRPKRLIAVINTSAKLIVPFGKYDEIRTFVDGYARVEIKDKNGRADGVINEKGRLMFKRPNKNNTYLSKDFHDGLAVVHLYKYWLPERKGTNYTSDKAYDGYINLKGEVLFNDTNREYLNNFSCKRAFMKDTDDRYVVIDTKFRKQGKTTFDEVINNEFKNGYALVRTGDGWGVIDTNTNFVAKPQFNNVNEIGFAGDYFFFYNDSPGDQHLYGIADVHGNIIVKPTMQNFDQAGFVNGLILGVVDNKLAYFNKNGGMVWQDKVSPDSTVHQKLNIDYMNRGYFYASAKADLGDSKDDNWAPATKISKGRHPAFEKGKLALCIDTDYKKPYQKDFSGYQMFVANTTGDTVKFNAQDGRLYLKLQARNTKGAWKDIEYVPNSWCGNSYHQIKLGPGNYWNFTIPQYDGQIKTQLRAKLTYVDPNDGKKSTHIYSNAINAGINPGQFWNKRQYTSQGLMDPYYE